MPSRSALRSVLHNFLGTFTSRYSDYDGYWVFGFLIRELGDADFDLLAVGTSTGDLLAEMHRLAAREFADQLAKAELDSSRLASARLITERGPPVRGTSSPESGGGPIHNRAGWDFRFLAEATTDTGRRFECETTVFVAPHDRTMERQSARHRWGRARVTGRLDE